METYVFYEIKCHDETITDSYIGSTINFNNRKRAHKYRCNTEGKGHNNKLYTYIRANGGWDNWIISQIDEQTFETAWDAKSHEQKLINSYKSTLNSATASCLSRNLYRIGLIAHGSI